MNNYPDTLYTDIKKLIKKLIALFKGKKVKPSLPIEYVTAPKSTGTVIFSGSDVSLRIDGKDYGFAQTISWKNYPGGAREIRLVDLTTTEEHDLESINEIELCFADEFGHKATKKFYGLTYIGEESGISVDDLVVIRTIKYTFGGITLLK